MHAEGPPLTNEAVEDQGGVLRDLVILDEDFLKLVDDQQDARHGIGVIRLPETGHVLHGVFAEQVAATLQFTVELLEHRKAEFAFALDGDHAGMRQSVMVIQLELHPLFEVDQIELDFIGAVVEGEARDQCVHERRLAGAGLAGDQRVLAGAFAELDVLQFLRTRGAERRKHFGRRAARPPILFLGRHAVEGHLHTLRGFRRLADPLDDPGEHFV